MASRKQIKVNNEAKTALDLLKVLLGNPTYSEVLVDMCKREIKRRKREKQFLFEFLNL